MKTTLKKIWSKNPCQDGWNKLVEGLRMPELKKLSRNDEAPEDIEVSLRFILKNNGWKDCKWAFRCVDSYEREFRLLAVAFARPVEHLTTDKASRALDVAEQFANELSTKEELEVVAKAYAASYAAACAACAAAAAYAAACAAYAAAAVAAACAADAADAAVAAACAAYAAAAVAAACAAYAADAAVAAAYASTVADAAADAAAYAAAYAAADPAYADDAAVCDADDADAKAAKAAKSARVKAIQAQISEFKRLLDCIESDETYNI